MATAAWGVTASATAALSAAAVLASEAAAARDVVAGGRGSTVRRAAPAGGTGGSSNALSPASAASVARRLPALPQRRAAATAFAGGKDETLVSPYPRGDLIFLSARPSFLRPATQLLAARVGLEGAAVLCGTVAAALTHSRMAGRKLANHLLHAACFPEARTVFFGDSGQADVAFALKMLAAHARVGAAAEKRVGLARVPPAPLVVIHDICGLDQVPITSDLQRARLRARGVHVIDSYIDAAVLAHGVNLITDDGLRSVVDAATEDLAAVAFAADAGLTVTGGGGTRACGPLARSLIPMSPPAPRSACAASQSTRRLSCERTWPWGGARTRQTRLL